MGLDFGKAPLPPTPTRNPGHPRVDHTDPCLTASYLPFPRAIADKTEARIFLTGPEP